MRGLLLDFNGTISDDEPILCAIFQELFAEEGRPLTEAEYYDELAGHSDPEIVEHWLGAPRPDLIERKVARYRERAATGETVSELTRTALERAAERVPVAIVSGAARAEIDLVLGAAGLTQAISAIVAADDVANGKPDPEGYLRALDDLRIEASDGVAVEDSDVGVAAAKAAGLRCLAVTGTFPAHRLAEADDHVETLHDAIARVGLL